MANHSRRSLAALLVLCAGILSPARTVIGFQEDKKDQPKPKIPPSYVDWSKVRPVQEEDADALKRREAEAQRKKDAAEAKAKAEEKAKADTKAKADERVRLAEQQRADARTKIEQAHLRRQEARKARLEAEAKKQLDAETAAKAKVEARRVAREKRREDAKARIEQKRLRMEAAKQKVETDHAAAAKAKADAEAMTAAAAQSQAEAAASARKAQEEAAQRKQAEQNRLAAEAQAKAEQARLTAEANAKAEQTRAEQGRIQREQAEQARLAAESAAKQREADERARQEAAKPKVATSQVPSTTSEFADGQVEGKIGMDDRAYAKPQDSDKKWRKPWNIRPIVWSWRLDSMTFKDYSATTVDGPLKATLGPRGGLGFGASMELLPFRGGAVSATWDYRLGFNGGLDLKGPSNYSVSSIDVEAQHQVSFGVDLGVKGWGSTEWHLGLEQRAERYKATGPEPGAVSSAWLFRPWARVGFRWSLDLLRDLRPFIGIDFAMPLSSANVDSVAYQKDLTNLLGTYPWAPAGSTVAPSSDAIAKAHSGKFQIGVTYGIRLFRPKRKWRAPITNIEAIPTRPAKPGDYVVPKEATEPGQEPKKPAPKKDTPKDPKDN